MTECNQTHENRPKIDLSLNQAGVIILFNSGVIYQNQTCGHACVQRCEEGILLLPSDPESVIGASVEVYLCPIWSELRKMQWWAQGIPEARASEIDALLLGYPPTKHISVDRMRLRDSEEAWVYVNIEPAEMEWLYSGFGSCKGVLVWPNSD